MSDAAETNSQPTTSEPDNSPEAWAAAVNDVEETPAEAPPSDSDGEPAAGDDGEPELGPDDIEPTGDDDPPEFWSAERKALWSKITDPEVRAAIRDHVGEVSTATARKLQENATKVREAEESAKAALSNQNQLAAWWQQNGQTIQRMVMGKWASVNWNQLAADHPAEYVRLKAEYEGEQNALRQMSERHDQEVKARDQRLQAAHKQERAGEHAKLATKYPNEFGAEKAEATYRTLSDYVLKHGISPDRLEGIYEAPVVEIIRKAYKYDQLQAKARTVTTPKQPAQSATTTPTRVAPGPAARSGNPEGEAKRQAIQALKSGKRLSQEEAGLAFA